MTEPPDVQAALEDLRSSEADRQGRGLLNARQIIDLLAQEAVEALRRGPYRLLVAERLFPLGCAVVPPLMQLFSTSTDPEVKLHAALVLMQFRVQDAAGYLLDQVEHGEAVVAANSLYRAGMTEGLADRIVARLANWGPATGDRTRLDAAGALLNTAESLGVELPSELRSRFVKLPIPHTAISQWVDVDELRLMARNLPPRLSAPHERT